jgi:hypothetical protein
MHVTGSACNCLQEQCVIIEFSHDGWECGRCPEEVATSLSPSMLSRFRMFLRPHYEGSYTQLTVHSTRSTINSTELEHCGVLTIPSKLIPVPTKKTRWHLSNTADTSVAVLVLGIACMWVVGEGLFLVESS